MTFGHLWLGLVVLLGTVLYLVLLPDASEPRVVAAAYAIGVVSGFFAGRRIG